MVKARAPGGDDPREQGSPDEKRDTAQMVMAPLITSSRGDGRWRRALVLLSNATNFSSDASSLSECASLFSFASEKHSYAITLLVTSLLYRHLGA